MNRGLCITIAACCFLLATPLAAETQQNVKVWRIGYLSPAAGRNPIDEAFERSMKDLGYIEGQNVRLERRYLAGHMDQASSAATELVQLNVDLLVAWGPGATVAAKNA